MLDNYSITANFEVAAPPSNATLIGNMTFPGTAGPRWAGRVMTVRFYDPATKNETAWSPLNGTTDDSGNFTVDNVTPGTWDVIVKNCSALSQLNESRTFTAGETTGADFGGSREGDCDSSDTVAIADRILLYNGWGKETDQPGYNVCCDLDRSGTLAMGDRIIMYANWGQSGDLQGYK